MTQIVVSLPLEALFDLENAINRAILQMIAWSVLPVVIGFLVSKTHRSVIKELSSDLGDQVLIRSRSEVILIGICWTIGGVMIGAGNLYFTRLARLVPFTPKELSESIAIWLVLGVGVIISIVGVGCAGWFYGTRIAWTYKDRVRQGSMEDSANSQSAKGTSNN